MTYDQDGFQVVSTLGNASKVGLDLKGEYQVTYDPSRKNDPWRVKAHWLNNEEKYFTSQSAAKSFIRKTTVTRSAGNFHWKEVG